MEKPVDMGGLLYTLNVIGASEALEVLNELQAKLREATRLVKELSELEVKVNFGK